MYHLIQKRTTATTDSSECQAGAGARRGHETGCRGLGSQETAVMNGKTKQQELFGVHETNQEVYRRIEKDGTLSKVMLKVFKILVKYGSLTGLTGGEVDHYYGSNNGHKRLSDLQKRGVIEEGKRRACSITGELVTTWHVTGDLPMRTSPRTGTPSPADIVAFLRSIEDIGFTPGGSEARVVSWLEYRVRRARKE